MATETKTTRTTYHVVDAWDGHRGLSIESNHRTREAAQKKADRLNRGLSGRKYEVIQKGGETAD